MVWLFCPNQFCINVPHKPTNKQTHTENPQEKLGPTSCNKLRKSLRAKLEVAHAAKKTRIEKGTDGDDAWKRLLLKDHFSFPREKQKLWGMRVVLTLKTLQKSVFVPRPSEQYAFFTHHRFFKMRRKLRWPGRSTNGEKQKKALFLNKRHKTYPRSLFLSLKWFIMSFLFSDLSLCRWARHFSVCAWRRGRWCWCSAPGRLWLFVESEWESITTQC